MDDRSAGSAGLPRTAYLDHTLRRARTSAEQRRHRYVTLEHLLLALLDDPDASNLLQKVGADIAVIHSAVTVAINNRMASFPEPDQRPAVFSYKYDPLFAGASEDAARMGCSRVNGAFALIGVAKDPESDASAILAANGFNPQAALLALRPTPAQAIPEQRAQSQIKPLYVDPPARSMPTPQAGREESMDDMMASVRSILADEERKERRISAPRAGLAPAADGVAVKPRSYAAARRPEPDFGQTAPFQDFAQADVFDGARFAETPAPEFDLEQPGTPAKWEEHPRSTSRGKTASASVLAKIRLAMPAKARVAVPETVKILLSKEEAASLFGWPRYFGSRQGPRMAAVTIRLSAPEGGFFIEGLTPETQWLLDRSGFAGQEPFGTWAWTAIPNSSGLYGLNVSISGHQMDTNGSARGNGLADQAAKVRIRSNFGRAFGRWVRAAALLLAGSGLTIGVYYAVKIASKLP